jgi:hypothetical protein
MKLTKICIFSLLLALITFAPVIAESEELSGSDSIFFRLSNLEKNIEIFTMLNNLALNLAYGKVNLSEDEVNNVISLYDTLITNIHKEIETDPAIGNEEYQKNLEDLLNKSKQLFETIENRQHSDISPVL